jgi:hypothetical protein
MPVRPAPALSNALVITCGIDSRCSSQFEDGGLPTIAAVAAAAAAQEDAARSAELQQVPDEHTPLSIIYMVVYWHCRAIPQMVSIVGGQILHTDCPPKLQEIDALHTEVHAAQQATGAAERRARGLQNEIEALRQAAQVSCIYPPSANTCCGLNARSGNNTQILKALQDLQAVLACLGAWTCDYRLRFEPSGGTCIAGRHSVSKAECAGAAKPAGRGAEQTGRAAGPGVAWQCCGAVVRVANCQNILR